MLTRFSSAIAPILKNFSSQCNIPTSLSNLSNNEWFWKSIGCGSAAVGFICFPFSPSSKNLLGGWNLPKIVIYIVVSTLLFCLVLFAKPLGSLSSRTGKDLVCFFVLVATSAFSFFEDISQGNAKENGLGVVSYGAFAIMSLSLSRQINFGFELGVFSFFLECVAVTAWKMNYKFGLGAAAFCYLLIRIRSLSDPKSDLQSSHSGADNTPPSRNGTDEEETVTIMIDPIQRSETVEEIAADEPRMGEVPRTGSGSSRYAGTDEVRTQGPLNIRHGMGSGSSNAPLLGYARTSNRRRNAYEMLGYGRVTKNE